MESREIDSKKAGKYSWFAARDARMRSSVNSTLYTEKDRVRAERMCMALTLVYRGKQFYVEYRKTFIAVKIDSPVVYDRKNLALLEADYTKDGIVKRVSSQGVIYRIPKV